MNFKLDDGSHAHLVAIVQTANYRRGYAKPPPDAMAELKLIAKKYLASDGWRLAPLILIGTDKAALDQMIARQQLPAVMCIGEFVSYRDRKDGSKDPVFMHVVWLQDSFVPHITPENEVALRRVSWENPNG